MEEEEGLWPCTLACVYALATFSFHLLASGWGWVFRLLLDLFSHVNRGRGMCIGLHQSLRSPLLVALMVMVVMVVVVSWWAEHVRDLSVYTFYLHLSISISTYSAHLHRSAERSIRSLLFSRRVEVDIIGRVCPPYKPCLDTCF